MSKEEQQATAEVMTFIEATKQSIPRIRAKAEQANRMGLSVLARSYDFLAKTLEQDLALQIRMLKGSVPPERWQPVKPREGDSE